MKFLPINQDRLWRSIENINRFGANGAGGVCRFEFSPEHKAARGLSTDWCQQAGCTVRADRLGNLFVYRVATHAGML